MEKQQEQKSEDLGIKLGSDEMVFWRGIIDAQAREIENIKKALKFSTWLRENAQKEYDKAEKEFENK